MRLRGTSIGGSRKRTLGTPNQVVSGENAEGKRLGCIVQV